MCDQLVFLQTDANLLGENQQKLGSSETEYFHKKKKLQSPDNEIFTSSLVAISDRKLPTGDIKRVFLFPIII